MYLRATAFIGLLVLLYSGSGASGAEWQKIAPGIKTIEADRPFSQIGPWKISTARFGVGCVASAFYDSDHSISIGGETPSKMALVVEADRKLFDADLDDDDAVDSIELVLSESRVSKLSPYGYRGTSGVVLPIDKALLQSLSMAPSLKLTERGSLKLFVPLKRTKEAIGKLMECFQRMK
jgi:hypothetical protein